MSGFNGKPVLVTGASGFIGSHLVEELVTSGAAVRAFVHYNSRGDLGNLRYLDADVLSNVEVLFGTVDDRESIAAAIKTGSVVFHLAALIGIPYSYRAPRSYINTNVVGTLNVLDASRSADVERVVHTSTSETYGSARYVPIDEAHPLQAQSPYSASKIAADKLAESYHLSFDLPITTLRPFNAFGPRQSLRAVIPTITAQALTARPIQLGSLTPIRDFTYVTDTARAFVAVAQSRDAIGGVFNVGSGKAISIGALAELIRRLAGSEAEVILDTERVRPDASEVTELVASAARLVEATDWRPSVSLEEGLRRTIEWIRTQPFMRPSTYTL